MARRDKVLAGMRTNPRDWTIADVETVCRHAGLMCAPPTGGGSHFKISHPDLPEILTVPFKRPIKPVYIRALIAMIDELERR